MAWRVVVALSRAVPALVAMFGFAGAAAAHAPLAAYGQLPGIDSVQVSPDGRRYAAIVGDSSSAQIQVRSLADGKLVSVSAVEKAKARSLDWAGADHLLATVSTTQAGPEGIRWGKREWYQVQDLDLTTRSSRRLLDKVRDTLNIVTGAPLPISGGAGPAVVLPGLTFIYGQGADTLYGVEALYRVDLARGTTVLAETGVLTTEDFVMDGAGLAVARADYDAARSKWTLNIRTGKDWKPVHVESADIDHPELLGLGNDGTTVLVRSRDSGSRGVHPVSLATGDWGAALPGIDPDGLISDPRTRRLLATTTTDMAATRYSFVDPADQQSWNAIARAFPGEQVTLESWSDDRMVVVVHVAGPSNGDGYFLVDRRARQARPLGSRYPGLTLADIGERRVIHYKAADGLDIPAYLTLPPGRVPKRLPLIVLPHGGPIARDEPGFDWWSQALASRGYAVLQPQFRGSAGLGLALEEAAYGQFGRKMTTDLSDGVARLVADGIVDAGRVCIAGASYGGYAALAGVALQSGIYRCASALAGPSDLRLFLGGTGMIRSSPKRSETQRFWLRLMGARTSSDTVLDTISPARLADRIKVPVQLIHGKDDTVVPFEQSKVMERALRAAGGKVDLVTLEGEDHWLSRATTRIAMLTAMVAFLEANNPPDPPPAK